MMSQRLDKELVSRNLATTRSQAESYIKLGVVTVNGNSASKPSMKVTDSDKIILTSKDQYVSRAGLKLASVAGNLKLDFRGKVVLDVGSSTGGFTDYALQHSAKKVIAVDVGTNQLHPSLHGNPQIELHEQTDIRDFKVVGDTIDIVVIDVSFISLRQILPHIKTLCNKNTAIVAMVKPQFEAGSDIQKNRGVIKNERQRRDILNEFELWVQKLFKVVDKSDSGVAGAKGNVERFYLLKLL